MSYMLIRRLLRRRRAPWKALLSAFMIPVLVLHVVKHKSQLTRRYVVSDIRNYNITLTREDLSKYYVKVSPNLICYKDGTSYVTDMCNCHDNFHGEDCGIPSAVWFSNYRNKYSKKIKERKNSISMRKIARRVVNAFPFNHEFDLLESRLNELYDSVDVFIIMESNISSYRESKPLRLYNGLLNNLYEKFQHKIIYIQVTEVSNKSFSSGWDIEEQLRMQLGSAGLQRIRGLADDDIFILSDADELPSKETVNFLKFYDGYSEPISFQLKWTIFGFFWKQRSDDYFGLFSNFLDKKTVVRSAVTIKMFRQVYFSNAYHIRDSKILLDNVFLKRYQQYMGRKKPWTIGIGRHYAGWHCSWCFRPEDVVVKMNAAQEDDKPRWGDFPDKKNISYIESLIRKGMWFDDKTTFLAASPNEPMLAPSYILEHPQKFQHLLHHD